MIGFEINKELSRQAGADENIYRTWDRIAMKFGLIDQLKIKAS